MKGLLVVLAVLVGSHSAIAQQSPHCGQNSRGSVDVCSSCIARTKPGIWNEDQRRTWCANRIQQLKAQGHKFK